jgi:hypothetical protein
MMAAMKLTMLSMASICGLWSVIFAVSAAAIAAQNPSQTKPFLITVNPQTHVIGNSLWNLTIVRGFGKKLWYRDIELVGGSSGHYVSYSKAIHLAWRILAMQRLAHRNVNRRGSQQSKLGLHACKNCFSDRCLH